jgi:hypothetical protein
MVDNPQKAIGPTFYNELKTAGFTGGISWDAAGNIYNLNLLSTDQQTLVEQVYAAHDPNKQLSTTTE